MSIFKSIFGGVEDKEREWAEAWGRVSDMSVEQLVDIVEARPNSPHGFLACVALFQPAPGELQRLVQKDERLASSLRNWQRHDALLLGKGEEFDRIRFTLKAIVSLMSELH